MKYKYCYILTFLCVYQLFSQEVLLLDYNPTNNTLHRSINSEKVKAGKKYTLKLRAINSAHVSVLSKITISEFVSEIPEVLAAILPGISDNTIFNIFGVTENGQRKAFLNALKSYNELELLRKTSDALYIATKFSPNPEQAMAKRDALKISLHLKSLDELAIKITQYTYFITALLESYSNQLKILALEDPNHTIILTEYATLKRIETKLTQVDYANKLRFIQNSLKATSHIEIDTFKAKKDIIDVELKLYDSFTKTTFYSNTISFKTYQNFSLDFSTGFFYSNIVATKYYLSPKDEHTNYVLKDKVDKNDVSIGALGHVTYKFTSNFSGGIALGASISPFDDKLRFLLGPSFIFGNQKQLSLTFGLALAQVNQLSDAILKDETGYFLPSELTEISTVKKVDTGLFFGISYNLTNKKK